MTSRQKSLYLVAKLYELAAEFTDDELRAIADEHSRQPQSSAIKNAVDALTQLHAVAASDHEATVSSSERYEPSAEASSLAELLSDRTVFATVGDIASTLAIEARPKEARERYISRVSRIVGSMESRDRTIFLKRIADKMSSRPGSFISNWSKLIKEM